MFDSVRMVKAQVKAVFDFVQKDEHAEMGIIKLVIGVFLIAILGGALLPTAIDTLETSKNSSGDWTASETATFGAIGILIIVAVIAGVAGLAYKAFE